MWPRACAGEYPPTGACLAVAGRRAGRLAPAAGIGAAAVTTALGCAAAVTRPSAAEPLVPGIAAVLRVDGLSAVMVLTVALVTLAVLIFAAGDIGAGKTGGRSFGSL